MSDPCKGRLTAARGKASASLAKQLERVARSEVSHIAMDTDHVYRTVARRKLRLWGSICVSRSNPLPRRRGFRRPPRSTFSPSPERRSEPPPCTKRTMASFSVAAKGVDGARRYSTLPVRPWAVKGCLSQVPRDLKLRGSDGASGVAVAVPVPAAVVRWPPGTCSGPWTVKSVWMSAP